MSGLAGRASLVLKITLACVMAVLATACATSASSNASSAGVEAIKAYNAQVLKALNAGDADAMNALMADDYVMFLQGRPPTQGIEAIRAANRGFLAQWHDQEAWTATETVVQGDLGFQWGTFELVLTPRAGGAARRSVGNYLHIYQRKADGKWRLTRAMNTTFAEKTP